MRIAFYAPMKPPSHPVPSGDRRMARALIAALRLAGHEVTVASRLRSWDAGDSARQRRIKRSGQKTAQMLIDRWQPRDAPDRPDAWFTYHLYHKAPDWLGPPVCDALGIPYLAAEASYAAKQADGPWAEGLQVSKEALSGAAAVFALSEIDRQGLIPHVAPGRLHRLNPFLDTAAYGARSAGCPDRLPPVLQGLDKPILLAVGMMRTGDKLDSYRVLGQALASLLDRPWSLAIVGDGPAQAQVRDLLPPDRTVFLGALPGEALPPLLGAADLFVWPAINEAYGMAILEAQAAGLPVVAGASGGVPDIVSDQTTGLLTPPGDGQAFAKAVADLLDDPARRQRMGQVAFEKTRKTNDIAQASAQLDAAVRAVA